MDRREFIKSAAAAAAIAALPFAITDDLFAADTPNAAATPEGDFDLAMVRGGEPEEMFRRGIEALGGMKAFVRPGQKVTIKPNIAWDQPPEMGANTNPKLVAEIVRQAIAAGASQVTVFDHTCNSQSSCYKNSGVAAAAEEAGAKVVDASRKSQYMSVDCPKAKQMKKALVHKAVMECDVYINVPVLKNHSGAIMTSALKNLMGEVYDRNYLHANGLSQCIADLGLYRKPDLNVVDAYRVMFSHGPRGVSPKDVQTLKYQIISRDMVAVDAVSARLMRYSLSRLPYLKMAEELGLGSSDVSKLKVKRIQM